MTDQLTLAEGAREEAIARVGAHAAPDFKTAAARIIDRLAKERTSFTTDDVWALLPEGCETHEPRAMGAAMRAAAKSYVIAPTDRTVNSTRPACHARPVRVWRSLTYRGRAA